MYAIRSYYVTLQDAVLTFDEAFILAGPQTCTGPNGTMVNYPAGQAIIQISTDGGSTWSNMPDDEVSDSSWRTGGVVTGSNSRITSYNVCYTKLLRITDNSTVATVSIQASTGTTVCADEDVTFSIFSISNAGTPNYTWLVDTGSGFSPSGNAATLTLTT